MSEGEQNKLDKKWDVTSHMYEDRIEFKNIGIMIVEYKLTRGQWVPIIPSTISDSIPADTRLRYRASSSPATLNLVALPERHIRLKFKQGSEIEVTHGMIRYRDEDVLERT